MQRSGLVLDKIVFTEFIFRDYSERLNSKYGKYSIHPIYASIYLGISFLFATPIYNKLKSKITKFILLLTATFLLLILLLLARKSVILIIIVIFMAYYVRLKWFIVIRHFLLWFIMVYYDLL